MPSLSELLLEAPRLGDKYGVNLRARLTDERLEALLEGAELTGDELKLLHILGTAIDEGGVIQEPMRPGRYHSVKTTEGRESTYSEDREWWGLLVQHLPPRAVLTTLPTLHKVAHPLGGYVIAAREELRPFVLRSTIHPKTLEELSLE